MRRVDAWACDHCRKRYTGGGASGRMFDHERHCYGNPGRTPREGEVYGIRHQTYEIDRDVERPWEPDACGVIYIDGEWCDVPGYSDCGEGEVWPHIDWGCSDAPLDKAPCGARLAWFKSGCPESNAPALTLVRPF